MSRPKHNAPCHCGSGKKYRNCHLQADRKARAEQAPASHSAPPGRTPAPAPSAPRPAWLRALPWVVGIAGSAAGAWVAAEQSKEGGLAMVVGSVVIAGMIRVFGDPPPPKDDAGDPGAINFGR